MTEEMINLIVTQLKLRSPRDEHSIKIFYKELFNDENLTGDKSEVYGDAKEVVGDVSDIEGDLTGIRANVQKQIIPILMIRQKYIDTKG